MKARTLYVREVPGEMIPPGQRLFEVTKLVNTIDWYIGEVLNLEQLKLINGTDITVTVGR